MGFISDVLRFERFNLKDMGRKVKDNPARLLYGGADALGTEIWNKALNRDDEPIVNKWGGADESAYRRAEQAGIDTGAGRDMHKVAEAVAAYYTARAAGNAMGGAGSGANGAGSQGWTKWLNLAPSGMGGGQAPPEPVKPPEANVTEVADPPSFEQILARYNANDGPMNDGRRIRLSGGNTATLLDESGRVIGRAPNGRGLYDALMAMDAEQG